MIRKLKTLNWVWEGNNVLLEKNRHGEYEIYVDGKPNLVYWLLAIPIIGNLIALVLAIISEYKYRQIGKTSNEAIAEFK